ncbi:MAG: exosortase A, partial [Gammaproteobacteria bacterium]
MSGPIPTPMREAASRLQMPALGRAEAARNWKLVFAAFAFACLLSFAAFPDAWLGMVRVWSNSDTYAHGFIALPCAAWMIWSGRHDWIDRSPRVWWPALFTLAGCGLLWLAGRLGGVASLEQFAAVAMIPATLLLICGPSIARALAFPLAFLFFAVPVGEFLTPIMMDYTADATVLALRWSGVPVYREGLHFMVPTGRWSVVEACSGLRYLIASLALGVLYAYLQFRTLKRRLGFMALALIVPIVANWVRAYLIVMLGHLSNMRIATGVDHLIYGWLFFGFVMALLFWIGSRRREPDPVDRSFPGDRRAAPGAVTNGRRGPSATSASGPEVAGPHFASHRRLAVAALAAAFAALVWRPVAAALLDTTQPVSIAQSVSQALAGLPQAPELPFQPAFSGATEKVRLSRQVNGQPVDVHALYYARQHETREMIQYSNVVVQLADRRWPILSSTTQSTPRGTVAVYRLGQRGIEDLLVWQWYVVGNTHTANPYVAKAATAWSLLTGRGDHSFAVVLATPIVDDSSAAVSAARQRLA